MWDDVTDLFTPDGVLEIGGVGIRSRISSLARSTRGSRRPIWSGGSRCRATPA
jgi:hypothetical protein